MIFSELYGAYYNAVARILEAAVTRPLSKAELRGMIERNAFGESVPNFERAIAEERWQLILPDGSTPIRRAPTMPLTTLEKRWLKAISLDPRIRLFTDEMPDFPDVAPLFTPDDVLVFDKYSDGDPFEDAEYIRNFRLILCAIREKQPLRIEMTNGKGRLTRMVIMPERLEYSEKDDKFRLIGKGGRYGGTVNLARITVCERYDGDFRPSERADGGERYVEFELVDRRNAAERVMMHFAHFKKEAERLDADRYRVRVAYDADDETELVIRLLSFGPMVKVTAPERFADLIKERLIKQKSCDL